MTENNTAMQPASSEEELVLVLDGIYSELAQDINAAKTAILNEVKYTAVQSQSVENDLSAKLCEQVAAIKALANELKYSLQQSQAVHTDISETIHEEVSTKLEAVDANTTLLEEIDKAVQELMEKISALDLDGVADKVLAEIPVSEEVDYDKIGETVAEKTEGVVSEHSRQILDAVAAIPVAENVDYTRIVEEVGDRVLEIVQEQTSAEDAEAKPADIDYDKIVFETAEKVVECLPAVEKTDYEKLSDMVAERVAPPAVDYDLLADKVAEKVAPPAVDYDLLADKVAEKIAPPAVDYDALALLVAAKVAPPAVDYDLLADKVAERLAEREQTAEVYIDGDGVQDIADNVADKVAEILACRVCVQAPAKEAVVEEAVVEEAAPVEEPVPEQEETPAAEVELATAEAAVEVSEETPVLGLVDAHSDLVVRLKRSFIAKLKQSEDDIKTYYSVLKNALTEYKKINSNISWHGDRFNYGRDTVARITIIGKTLGLYLALDPADPEFKQTVYRQKDVSKQKAYEGTPFMVKIKSDGGLKKALRLVLSLAEKLGTEKDETFSMVDYVAMYPQATDEEMLQEGLIKETKEKKVALDF